MKEKKITLLDKALQVSAAARSPHTDHDPDELAELALAWIEGRIRTKGISVAMGHARHGSVYNSVALGLRHAYQTGRLKIMDQAKTKPKVVA